MAKKVKWMGNTASGHREFHRIVEGEDHDARCNLDSIKPDNQVFAKTAKALRDQGFDAAKFCNVRFRSTR